MLPIEKEKGKIKILESCHEDEFLTDPTRTLFWMGVSNLQIVHFVSHFVLSILSVILSFLLDKSHMGIISWIFQ